MNRRQTPVLNGATEAKKIIKLLKYKTIKLPGKPTLAVILIGNNPASQTYINIKEKRAREIGVSFKKFLLPASTSEKKVVTLIEQLNKDKKITGILVQLPLPKKFKTNKIVSQIKSGKDVDGLNSLKHKNIKTLKHKNIKFEQKLIISPTIQSILHLIKMPRVKLAEKKAVILCNSPEFAKSLKFLLEKSLKIKKINIFLKPKKLLANQLKSYDLIIVALGKKHWLKPAMIKKDSILIDVGINRVGKKIYGDVHPDCLKKTKYISPVPGGVGPLTVAYLFKNLLKLRK